jgi:LacI family transcriptional regulator
MENAIFARALQAFQDELRRNGVTLLVSSSSYKAELENEQIRTLAARGADGLLLIGAERDPAIYESLKARNIPCLIAWVYDPKAHAPTIGFDNKIAMQSMLAKVLEFGHRHIGLITAKQKGNDRARARVQAIKEGMRKAGLGRDHLQIIETDYGIEQGAKACAELLDQKQSPSVIMCGNDVLAAGALNKARELGLKVPKDISITGFDDIELASICVPALTTVHVPHHEMGKQAAQILLQMIDHQKLPQSICLPTELRLRGSLGPSKAR